MAVPKVFVSSTCFDLGEVRDQLKRFIEGFGFDPVLSEYGDVFYHPDLHTHDACIHEVSNCQLFILIIGGRFGGEYQADKSKSITNAEYDAARENNIPVFTYVRSGVLSNQHIYKKNKNKEFASEIEYPSIEKQEYAVDIFSFIDEVNRSPVNNAFEGFDNFVDIASHLKKQWAGMFFDFLKSREIRSQIDANNHMLSSIKNSSGKLEELVKSLYRSVAEESADQSINNVEIYNKTKNFFYKFDKVIEDTSSLLNQELDVVGSASVSPDNKKWYEYLGGFDFFGYEAGNPWSEEVEDEVLGYLHLAHSPVSLVISEGAYADLENLFEDGVLNSTIEQRVSVLRELLAEKSAE